jgi:RNA polymerase sigma-70 factor (ECF subfamily)
VHNAIKDLPAGGRTILVLHAMEGYKHREIAEMLGISESTSKSQYRRALDILFINLKQKIYVG